MVTTVAPLHMRFEVKPTTFQQVQEAVTYHHFVINLPSETKVWK